MDDHLKHIRERFGGRLIGSDFMKNMVSLAVSKLPKDIAERIIENCWIVSSMEDAWGYAFDGNDLLGKHLIFLSDHLFHQNEDQILYTIIHEIGHVVLKHRNSIGFKQTQEEIDRQESEADQFARRYLLQAA